MRELDLHVEVDFSGFPFFAGFTEECGNQTEEGGFVGESAAFEFLVDAFEGIGGSQASLMCRWQSENGEAPVCLGFEEGDTDAQNGAVAGGGNTQRKEDGTVA